MFVGIDLAAKQERPTGFCILNKKARTELLFSDEQIINAVLKAKPKVVAIDAPLSIPSGNYRKCDMLVRRAGIPIFSFALPQLKMLGKRGIKIAKQLRNKGFTVIETYPYAVIRMNKEISFLARRKKFKNKHERDAFVCALVAKNFAKGKASCFAGGGKIFY